MRVLFFYFLILIFHSGCNRPSAQDTVVVPVIRDTTITVQNAYSHLSVDSLKMESFLASEVSTDSTRQRIRNFYNSRNYGFAWFNADGLTVQAEGFWNLHDSYVSNIGDSSFFNKQLHALVDTLLYGDSLFKPDKETLHATELRLTKHFFDYIQAAYGAKADPEELQWYIPKQKLDPSELLDSLFARSSGDWRPLNTSFYRLQNAISKYRNIQRSGGWKIIEVGKQKWKTGSKDKMVTAIKKRLASSGDYISNDTSRVFTDSLAIYVKRMQQRFGLTANGVVDAALVKELNIPVEDRIKQMLVNIERMKWMPAQARDFIVVNIPEYRFRLYEDGKPALEMDVVVGKAASHTVIFSDTLKYVVFSPYWNVPSSIVRNEIYPAMQRSRSYLARNNMEVTGYSGGLPVVRQKPGGGNALGQVKFLFPNTYNIYFHDTPSKSLFSKDKRAFSHGCIRLHKPFELARYLLRTDTTWTEEKIRTAMNSSKEKWVAVPKTYPVYITYFTSWADENGVVHFREDIYGHDKKLEERLFQ